MGIEKLQFSNKLSEYSHRIRCNPFKVTKRWHDKRIKKKSFDPGDKVLLFNSRFKLFDCRKLRSKWDSPFTVLNSTLHGVVTLQDSDKNTFKVNGQRLKIFLEPNMPNLEEFDVIEVINLID
jgi:hypothetical protein